MPWLRFNHLEILGFKQGDLRRPKIEEEMSQQEKDDETVPEGLSCHNRITCPYRSRQNLKSRSPRTVAATTATSRKNVD